jgi:uncharacterized protein (DUF697 family)
MIHMIQELFGQTLSESLAADTVTQPINVVATRIDRAIAV